MKGLVLEKLDKAEPKWPVYLAAFALPLAVILVLAVLTPMRSPYQEAIDECEGRLKDGLKAPSSYKRIDASALLMSAKSIRESNAEMKKLGLEYFSPSPEEDTLNVDIEYDAVNSFNAPIRSHSYCKFKMDKGEPVYGSMSVEDIGGR